MSASPSKVTVIGVRICTVQHVLERATEVVTDGGTDRLARCLVNMPNKQAVVLIAPAVEDKFPRKGSVNRAVSRSMQKGRQRGAVGVRGNPQSTGRGRSTVVFP